MIHPDVTIRLPSVDRLSRMAAVIGRFHLILTSSGDKLVCTKEELALGNFNFLSRESAQTAGMTTRKQTYWRSTYDPFDRSASDGPSLKHRFQPTSDEVDCRIASEYRYTDEAKEC